MPAYNSTQQRHVDLIDASSKHSKRDPSVEQEVGQRVPAISADADHAAKNTHKQVVFLFHSLMCYQQFRQQLQFCSNTWTNSISVQIHFHTKKLIYI